MIDVIVLAGGFGSRLQSVVRDVPKPMAMVAGKPFLHYLIQQIQREDIGKLVFSLGYKHEIITSYVQKEYPTLPYDFSIEDTPLFTGGAIRLALEKCHTDLVLVINGDTYFGVNISEMIADHVRTASDITISLKHMQNFDRYGTVHVDANQRITKFNEKVYTEEGLINAGYCILNKKLLLEYPVLLPFSFEQDFLQKRMQEIKVSGFVSDGYFIDIGIPEDYLKANNEFGALFNR